MLGCRKPFLGCILYVAAVRTLSVGCRRLMAAVRTLSLGCRYFVAAKSHAFYGLQVSFGFGSQVIHGLQTLAGCQIAPFSGVADILWLPNRTFLLGCSGFLAASSHTFNGLQLITWLSQSFDGLQRVCGFCALFPWDAVCLGLVAPS
jgi:hypothetical protein